MHRQFELYSLANYKGIGSGNFMAFNRYNNTGWFINPEDHDFESPPSMYWEINMDDINIYSLDTRSRKVRVFMDKRAPIAYYSSHEEMINEIKTKTLLGWENKYEDPENT